MRQLCSLAGTLVALSTLAPAARADAIPWDLFDTSGDGGTAGGFAYGELLKNGTFDLGDDRGTLNHWTPLVDVGPDWAALDGTVGAFPFGPDAGDYFATTLTGGNSSWPLGVTRSTLEQTVALPAHADAAVRVRVDAYTARDRVGFELVWLTDDATGGLVPLDAVDLGEYGGSNGGSLAQVDGVYDVPLGATHATFRSIARLTDGYWIDAGFDNASLLMAQPIPEPATAGVLALAAGALALRRRG